MYQSTPTPTTEQSCDQASVYALPITSTTQQIHDEQRGRGRQLPLYRPFKKPRPFPFHLLGPTLGAAAKTLHDTVQAPDAVCGQSVLAAAALAAQALANVVMDGRAIPLSLFFVTIAPSGERKSAVDRVVLAPFKEKQQALMQAYTQRYQQYLVEQKQWGSAPPVPKRKTASIAARMPQPPPEKPRRPLLLVSEPTMEGLIHQLREGYLSIGLFSDEAGAFLGGYSCRQDRRMHATATLCKLWDGDPIDRVRRCDEGGVIYGARCSLHLMGQEMLLQSLVQDHLSEGMGLLSRCLISSPEPLAGRRIYQSSDLGRNAAIQGLTERYQQMLNMALGDGKHAIPAELPLRSLGLSETAAAVWVVYHDHTELQLGASGKFREIQRLGSKAPELVLRLAGVLTLVDDPSAELISLETLNRATLLMDWYLEEALRLKAQASVSAELSNAERLVSWMHERNSSLVWIGDVYQYGPSAFRKADEARRCLLKLEEHGLLRKVPEGAEVGGVWRAEVWEMT